MISGRVESIYTVYDAGIIDVRFASCSIPKLFRNVDDRRIGRFYEEI
jgi:hypothetical protein